MRIRTAVDLFAGLGGATTGMESAGIRVLLAANHWDFAVQTHSLNHPKTTHALQDLRQADFTTWPDVDIGWASPACQGHSQASQPQRKRDKGVRATHDRLRATAWAVVDYAEIKRPPILVIENVVDFRRWQLYPKWKEILETLGYGLSENVLTASRWGVPQRRKRLYIIGMLDQDPVALFDPAVPEPPCSGIIDWGQGDWRAIDSLPKGPKRRILRAWGRGLGKRFLIQNVTGHRGVPLDEPIRTITTADQWAVVDGGRYRTLTVRENLRAMGFPETYQVPSGARRRDCIRAAGNAVCPPQAAGIVRCLNQALLRGRV